MENDEWEGYALDLDDEPIAGLGELPDCDDDSEACQVVGPGDGEVD